jgi:hypothetical protein
MSAPTAGLVWVASQITQPAHLSEAAFLKWYEDQHVDEVVSLPGIRSAARYEAVPLSSLTGPPPPTPSGVPTEAPPPWLLAAKWLTLYDMHDVEYRHTPQFKGLDGQASPKDDLLPTIFKRAKFETRFARLASNDGPAANGGRPSSLIISATITPGSQANSLELDKWYREEHVPLLSKCPGYVRTRRYQLVDTTVLDEFERRSADPVRPGSWLALHEFEGEYFDMGPIAATDETEWTKNVLQGVAGMEAGFYRLRRTYGSFPGGGREAKI